MAPVNNVLSSAFGSEFCRGSSKYLEEEVDNILTVHFWRELRRIVWENVRYDRELLYEKSW